jgi:hypothetical protein
MKLSKSLIPLLIFTFFFLLNTCDTIPEQTDECEKTKWTTVREPTIYLYIAVPITNCDKVNNRNATDSATQMICSGSITKIYCGGKVSGSFNFNNNFYPIQITEEELYKRQVGQAYQFKFQNDNDYLIFVGRLKAYFTDGIIWESEEINFKIYYKDIKTDPSSFEKYSHTEINSAILWYRVYR